MSEDKFDRGSALTIFKNDRQEDLVALVLAFAIAAIVYFLA
jgi:hypothetical protein